MDILSEISENLQKGKAKIVKELVGRQWSKAFLLKNADTIAMGNVDPAGQFRNRTPESIRQETWKPMESCCKDNQWKNTLG